MLRVITKLQRGGNSTVPPRRRYASLPRAASACVGSLLALQCLALLPFRRQLAVLHAFELQSIGVEEEYGVVVFVVFVCRIDDLHFLLLQKGLQGIDVGAIAQLEGVVVEADVADLVRLAALGRGDPVTGLAVGPADRTAVVLRDLEAQEG